MMLSVVYGATYLSARGMTHLTQLQYFLATYFNLLALIHSIGS